MSRPGAHEITEHSLVWEGDREVHRPITGRIPGRPCLGWSVKAQGGSDIRAEVRMISGDSLVRGVVCSEVESWAGLKHKAEGQC